MNTAGALIRQLRMERNYSQAGLARGICAASYLSKIEQGQAEASQDILDRLFAALGVSYCRDEGLIKEGRERLEQYLEARDQNEELNAATEWLDAQSGQLTYSRLNLWMGIYGACRSLDALDAAAAKERLRELKQVEPQMDAEQRYRYLLCSSEASHDPAQALALAEQAANWKNCAHVHWARARVHFHMGQYSRCMEAAERAYAMASEEGDLYVLMWASFLMGSCCTDRDLAMAEKYYRRAIRLSRSVYPAMEHLAAYNLGASYLEWGQLDPALYWLERADQIPGEDPHNLLLCQKRAILYARLGRTEAGMAELKAGMRILKEQLRADAEERQGYGDMLEFARMLLERQQYTPAFETVVLRLIEQAEDKWGFGFRRFYSLYLVELYRSQRRYKEALRIMGTLQENLSSNR